MVIESFAEIVDFPTSSNKTLGSSATFHCSGQGDELFWLVDGASQADVALKQRGITFDKRYDGTNDLFMTWVHVPCDLQNNNTEVQCALVENGRLLYSDAALLMIQGKPWVNIIRYFLYASLIAKLRIN